MKLVYFLTIFTVMFSVTTFSQSTPTEAFHNDEKTIQPEPMFVIKLSNGEVYVQQPLLEKIDPNWIDSISVFKNLESEEIKHYGKRAENGLVLIYIKKENEEDVKKILPQ